MTKLNSKTTNVKDNTKFCHRMTKFTFAMKCNGDA